VITLQVLLRDHFRRGSDLWMIVKYESTVTRIRNLMRISRLGPAMVNILVLFMINVTYTLVVARTSEFLSTRRTEHGFVMTNLNSLLV
jgi:hypothetical protein